MIDKLKHAKYTNVIWKQNTIHLLVTWMDPLNNTSHLLYYVQCTDYTSYKVIDTR